MRGRSLAAALLLPLAGCGGGSDEPQLNNQQFGELIENISEARPEPSPEPPAAALLPIDQADAERALPAGAGCDFSESGRLLFVATRAGEALARVNGSEVRFAASGPMGPSGGFFVNERYSISIGRLADAGVTVGAWTTWPARIVFTDRRRDDAARELRIEGAWRCRA